jgi:predicted aminopeptidase
VGVRRWLKQQGRDKDLADYLSAQQRYRTVIELLIATRTQLRAVYASGAAPELMREQKRETLAAMRQSYAALKTQWGGHAPFDAWFAEDINNAHLASISTYFTCVPGFERELKAVDDDLPAFYRRVRALAKLDQSRRDVLVCGASLE